MKPLNEKVLLLATYVMDIGCLDNGKYALIEFNPPWASGIYGADPTTVVLECLQAACEKNELK